MRLKLQETSFEYRIDSEHGLGLARLSGDVDAAFIVECAGTLQADQKWAPTYDVIWDDRQIQLLDVTLEGLDEMVKMQADGQVGEDLVVTANESHEIVMRLYAWRTRQRGRPAAVFETMDEALAHLGYEALPPALQF